MKTLEELVATGKTLEDIVSYLVITDQHANKSLARTEIQKYLDDNKLEIIKPVSKAQQLKDDFLQLDNPLDMTKEQIKALVIKHDHKAGSIQYYVNSYLLAIDLVKKIQAK